MKKGIILALAFMAALPAWATDYNINTSSVTISNNGSHKITGNGSVTTNTITVDGGVTATITLNGVKIDVSSDREGCAFKLSGNAKVTLVLEGENSLVSGEQWPGVGGSGGGWTLTIQGTTGSLTAQGGGNAAGIGGSNYSNCGRVIIEGGTVTAKGGGGGAGIGGGYMGKGGTIEIKGGTVTAKGGGAGIGGGESSWSNTYGDVFGDGGTILITGGTVTATSEGNGAGIGGGGGGGRRTNPTAGGGGGDINIQGGTVTAKGGGGGAGGGGGGGGFDTGPGGNGGGITIQSGAMVTATGGGGGGAGIGSGKNGSNGGSLQMLGATIVIADSVSDNTNTHNVNTGILIVGDSGQVYNNVILERDFTVPAGTTLTVLSGATLNVSAVTVTNNGTIINHGSIYGTISPPAHSPLNNKPVALTATPIAGGAVRLSWTAGDNRGSAITKYQYSASSGADSWKDILSSDALTTIFTTPSLTTSSGTSYTFKVRAVNAVGDGTPSDSVTATPDGDKPTVYSISPDKNATGVAVDGTIVIIFNEPMKTDAGTVKLNGIGLTSGGSWSNTTYTIPYSGLDSLTDYTIAISGFQDVAGNMMVANEANKFTTKDVTPPTVGNVSPANGVADVAVSGTIEITFNEDMDSSAGTVKLNGKSLTTGGSWSNTTYTISYSDLGSSTKYNITISGFKDAAGNEMVTDSSYVFTTKDIINPTVKSVTPSGPGAGVNGNIVITFDEPMKTGAGTVKLNGKSLTTGGSWSNTTYTIPYSGLDSLTDYTIAISGFQDVAGNMMVTNEANKFTTKDVINPTVKSITPSGPGAEVSGTIKITFSKTMDRSVAGTVSLAGGSNTLSTGTWSDNNTTYTIPYSGLGSSTGYTITINGFRDMAENELSYMPGSHKFTTKDVIPPTVNGISPANGTSGVAVDGTIVITFSEAMDSGAGTVKLGSNTLSPGGSPWSENNTTYTIPYSGLAYSKEYIITLTGFKDAAGNGLNYTAGPHKFTTKAEPSAPELSLVTLAIDTGQSKTFTVSLGKDESTATGADVSSSDTTIATVSPATLSRNGSVTVTGVKAGTATITVTFSGGKKGGSSSTIAVTVTDLPFPEGFSVGFTKKLVYGDLAHAVITGGPADPGTLKYQWYRNGSPVPGATRESYRITGADLGKKLSVKIYSDKYPGGVTSEEQALE